MAAAMSVTELWLTRHGESTGNVAASQAEASGDLRLALGARDADVPLTDVGLEQASALGHWIAEQASAVGSVWVSPYERARQTSAIALAAAGITVPPQTDERLRDRELGILDLVTTHGVEHLYPDEADRRRRLGKFWYRPPGGESWADVALRVRSILPTILAGDGPALVIAHDVVVSVLVYVLCGMSEQQIMELVGRRAVGNATVTRVIATGDRWQVETFADPGHLLSEGAPVTGHADEGHADVV